MSRSVLSETSISLRVNRWEFNNECLTVADGSQNAEALVDSLSEEGSTLSEANLSGLSTTDFEQLAQLSQELHLATDMDSESDVLEIQEEVQTEMVQPEIGTQEIEIETEQVHEEIVHDVRVKSAMPPLRPLTIAPKPTKVPITLKSASGQQLLLLPGGTTGQPLKIVSSQSQGLSVANISLGKPIALRPAGRTVTPNKMSVLQPKQVIMKKVLQQPKLIDAKNIVIAEKLEPQSKSSQGNIVLPSTAKTITLAQAQQIGLLTGAKLVPQVAPKQAIVVNKAQTKAIKILPQGKQHAKILPAPQTGTPSKGGQRIILKQANANSAIMAPGQIIQVTGGQPLVTGQLHQINIPGKGVQYIKIVTPTSSTEGSVVNATAARSTIQTSTDSKVPIVSIASSSPITKPTNVILTETSSTKNIAPKPIKATTTTLTRANTIHIPTTGPLLMVPTGYISQSGTPKVPIPAIVPANKVSVPDSSSAVITELNLESNGMRPRKPCNCTKSQCLKLYCDCFANGEFCHLCNCLNCFNNLENEENRQRAIKSCLDRNPNAFRPKIGKAKDMGDSAIRKHTKGCNCKRSGCLKNYCECYEAKIACSSNCKCMGCRNIEDSMDKKSIRNHISLNSQVSNSPPLIAKIRGSSISANLQFRPRRHSNNKQAFSYITEDVIEATSQCLLTISDSAEEHDQDEEITKCQIIQEFGRCLMEIIDCSTATHNTSSPVN